MARKRVSWALEADLKNFFGSLDHRWMMRFSEHWAEDPTAPPSHPPVVVGVLKGGQIHESTEGTPQGSSIRVLLRNVCLHYTLDLWFTKAIQPKLCGEGSYV